MYVGEVRISPKAKYLLLGWPRTVARDIVMDVIVWAVTAGLRGGGVNLGCLRQN